MKFLYEYRTSDNVKHNGIIAASDREAAFTALKARGIRPGFLAEAPGFFNKLLGKGKRWIAIGVLAVLVVVAAFVIQSNNRDLERSQSVFDAPGRRQLIGDTAVIEKGVATGWSDVFSAEGDRFLASFAIPGADPAVKSTTVENLQSSLDASAVPSATPSSLEARQIVAIVNGMKREINDLRAAGWTLKEVGAALVQRQEKELRYYRIAERAIETAKNNGMSQRELLELWERKNDDLRNLGVRLLPMPD